MSEKTLFDVTGDHKVFSPRKPMDDKEYDKMIMKFIEDNRCIESRTIIEELKREAKKAKKKKGGKK